MEVNDTLMKAIHDGNGDLFFLDAPGGTGKTFIISLILATCEIGHCGSVAYSGIGATFLNGCHSALKLPLNLQNYEQATCNISKQSAMAKILEESKIMIWDKCKMAHMHIRST